MVVKIWKKQRGKPPSHWNTAKTNKKMNNKKSLGGMKLRNLIFFSEWGTVGPLIGGILDQICKNSTKI